MWLKKYLYKSRRLYVTYNNAIRRFLHLPCRCSASQMYVVTNIPSPLCIIRKNCFSIYSRVLMSPNLVRKLFIVIQCILSRKSCIPLDATIYLFDHFLRFHFCMFCMDYKSAIKLTCFCFTIPEVGEQPGEGRFPQSLRLVPTPPPSLLATPLLVVPVFRWVL